MSEENGAMVVPIYYANLGTIVANCFENDRSHSTFQVLDIHRTPLMRQECHTRRMLISYQVLGITVKL